MVAGHVSPFSILALLLHTFCFVNRSMRHSNNLHFGFCFNLNVDKVSVNTYDAQLYHASDHSLKILVHHFGYICLTKRNPCKYLVARIQRYPNSNSTIQLTHLVVSGDISPNPKPEKCNVCSRTIAHSHCAVCCDSCKGQLHIKCANIKTNEYRRIQQLSTTTWSCMDCVFKPLLMELLFHEINIATFEEMFAVNQTDTQVFIDDTGADLLRDLVNFRNARSTFSKQLLMGHININSIQNKF